MLESLLWSWREFCRCTAGDPSLGTASNLTISKRKVIGASWSKAIYSFVCQKQNVKIFSESDWLCVLYDLSGASLCDWCIWWFGCFFFLFIVQGMASQQITSLCSSAFWTEEWIWILILTSLQYIKGIYTIYSNIEIVSSSAFYCNWNPGHKLLFSSNLLSEFITIILTIIELSSMTI